MIPVNSAYFIYLTSELAGGADIDELTFKYYNIDPNNETVMKDIIKSTLKPTFDRYSPLFKQKVKDCLGFYLSTGKIDFERVYNAPLLPIDTPKNPKLFYIWIWEIYFPGEDYHIYTVNNYYEKYDIEEPLRV